MLGQYLKRFRLSKNLSQKAFAELLETSQSYYSRLETNKVKPGIQMIANIARVLKVEQSFIRELL